MKRKHHDLIIAWANGERIQYLNNNREWIYTDIPLWDDSGDYRLEPKTININGFEVPEPLYKKPVGNIKVYYPICPCVSTVIIDSDRLPDNVFNDRFVFKTKEDCQKYIDAFLSFTKK